MKPLISEYINIFQFLQDYYSYRKSQEPGFSYAVWGRELGIKNKSYIRFVVLGKRPISAKLMETLKNHLEFDSHEKKIFEVLCLYTQSRSEKERKLMGKELIQLLRTPALQENIVGHHDMLMDPLALVIRTLLTFQDIKKTSQELAQILETTPAEVNKALDVLIKLQLVEENQGRYASHHKHTSIPDNFHNLGMDQFYRRSFQEAQKAINFPKDSRRYRSWYVALSEEEFKSFVSESEGQLREQVLRRDGEEFSGKRLYQVLFSSVPVSK